MGFLEKITSYFMPKEENGPAGKIGRNDACWCGSGKKYKKCHLAEDEKKQSRSCALNCGPT